MGKNEMVNVPIRYSTQIAISPTSIHKLNPEFSLCDVDVMYVDENRNGTDISKEVVENAIYSLYGVPIVGEWVDGENRFGDHGEKIEITRDKISCTITTKPIGFVTKEAIDNYEWVDKPLSNGHEIKTWLRLKKCILWTGRYEECQSIIDNGTFQSMEVKFLDGEYTEKGYFKPSEMIFSALCAIGVEPCFEESNIRRASYELDSFKLELQSMLEEYKTFKELGNNSPIQNKLNNNKANKEENIFMDLEKLNSFLSTFTFKDAKENIIQKYSLIGEPIEAEFVVMDKEDRKAYAVGFALDEEENIVADFESKVEKKFAIVDVNCDTAIELPVILDEYCQARVDSISEELGKSYNAKIDEMASDYEKLASELKDCECKLADFEKQKAEADKIAHKEEIDKVIDNFSKKIGRSPKFLVYKAKLNADEVTTEQVTKDLTLMAGEELIGSKVNNFSYQPQETNIKKSYSEQVTSRYGHLLDKYIK